MWWSLSLKLLVSTQTTTHWSIWSISQDKRYHNIINSFQAWANVCQQNQIHHFQENLPVQACKKCRFLMLASAALYILPRNDFTHQTTVGACFSNPTKESMSYFVAVYFPSQIDKVSLICTILSAGNPMSMCTVSKTSNVWYYRYINYHDIIVNIVIMIWNFLYRCIATCMNMDKTNDQTIILVHLLMFVMDSIS